RRSARQGLPVEDQIGVLVRTAPGGPDPRLLGSAAHGFVDDLAAPVLSDGDAHHLTTVLRLRDGEVVTVGDGRGAWRECAFRQGGRLDVVGDVESSAVPPPRLPPR